MKSLVEFLETSEQGIQAAGDASLTVGRDLGVGTQAATRRYGIVYESIQQTASPNIS